MSCSIGCVSSSIHTWALPIRRCKRIDSCVRCVDNWAQRWASGERLSWMEEECVRYVGMSVCVPTIDCRRKWNVLVNLINTLAHYTYGSPIYGRFRTFWLSTVSLRASNGELNNFMLRRARHILSVLKLEYTIIVSGIVSCFGLWILFDGWNRNWLWMEHR